MDISFCRVRDCYLFISEVWGGGKGKAALGHSRHEPKACIRCPAALHLMLLAINTPKEGTLQPPSWLPFHPPAPPPSAPSPLLASYPPRPKSHSTGDGPLCLLLSSPCAPPCHPSLVLFSALTPWGPPSLIPPSHPGHLFKDTLYPAWPSKNVIVFWGPDSVIFG